MKYNEEFESLFKEIDKELEKEPGDMDCDKVDSLLETVNIDNEAVASGMEEIIRFFGQKQLQKTKRKRKTVGWRKFIAVTACVIAIVFVGTIVSSYALGVNILDAPLCEWPKRTILFLKEKVFYKEGNREVYNDGKKTREYSSYDELCEKENINILRLECLPDGYKLDSIKVFGSEFTYDIFIEISNENGESISYSIWKKSNAEALPDMELFQGREIFKAEMEGLCQVSWIYNDWYSTISGKVPMDVLLQILADAD